MNRKIAVESCWGFGNFMHAIALPLIHIKEQKLKLALTFIDRGNCGMESGKLRNILEYFSNQFDHGIEIESEDESIFDQKNNILFRGFNMNYSYETHKDMLIDVFKPSERVRNICDAFFNKNSIDKNSDYISLTIRGGDYATYYNNVTEILTKEYFLECLEKLPKDLKVIVNVIPKEEVGYYKEIFNDKRFVFCDVDYPDFLPIISNAKYCIISNSTFFWWGAFLNKKATKVFYPLPWFRDFNHTQWMPSWWTSVVNKRNKVAIPPLTGKDISDVTLVIVDCIDDKRAQETIDKCLSQVKFSKIVYLTSLETSSPYAVKINAIKSMSEYSNFIAKKLHAYIQTSHCLIVQYDGWIVDGKMWDNCFLSFDYIGCNTIWTYPHDDNGKGGNGGFSLRSKRLLEYSAKYGPSSCHPEDLYFSQGGKREFFEDAGFIFAPRKIQDKFGLELSVWNGQFGHHKCNLHNKENNFMITLENMENDKIYYGADGKYVECTNKLKDIIKNGFVIDNGVLDKLVGDPNYGVTKHLFVYGSQYLNNEVYKEDFISKKIRLIYNGDSSRGFFSIIKCFLSDIINYKTENINLCISKSPYNGPNDNIFPLIFKEVCPFKENDTEFKQVEVDNMHRNLPMGDLQISHRNKFSKIAKKYLIPNDEIQDIITSFTEKMGKCPLGLHYRGNDKAYEQIVMSPSVFLDSVKKVINCGNFTSIFVATDSSEMILKLKDIDTKIPFIFNDKLIRQDNPTLGLHHSNLQNTNDLLKYTVVDCFCLSKCSMLMSSGSSNLSEVAAILNPDIPWIYMR